MQIHELPAGAPASGVQFAGDTGTQTQKIDYDALAAAILNQLTSKEYTFSDGEEATVIDAINTIKDGLGEAASKGVANDLVTTAAGLVLDARQGKALKDLHDTNANAIASLNSRTTVQNLSSKISVTSAIALQSDCFLLRFGNLCVLQMRFRLNEATTANTKIAQLPVHPYNGNSNGHILLAFRIWEANSYTITAYIQPDGSVNISAGATAPAGNSYVIQTTFMCAN